MPPLALKCTVLSSFVPTSLNGDWPSYWWSPSSNCPSRKQVSWDIMSLKYQWEVGMGRKMKTIKKKRSRAGFFSPCFLQLSLLPCPCLASLLPSTRPWFITSIDRFLPLHIPNRTSWLKKKQLFFQDLHPKASAACVSDILSRLVWHLEAVGSPPAPVNSLFSG